jgi:hypothetical protein
MKYSSVFCIADTAPQAEQIVSSLKANGFTSDDISLLFPDKESSHEFSHRRATKAPEGIAAGVTAGGLVAGAAGWMVGAGTLLLPGFGVLLAIGPIMAALSAAAVGATIGGVTGGLIGLGMPELEATRFEGRLKAGNYLIAVHAVDHQDVANAEAIFKACGATDICRAAEKPVNKKDRAPREVAVS